MYLLRTLTFAAESQSSVVMPGPLQPQARKVAEREHLIVSVSEPHSGKQCKVHLNHRWYNIFLIMSSVYVLVRLG